MPYGPIPTHPRERFWSKVGGPKESGDCWEWLGARQSNGYGFLHAGPLYHTGQRWVKAHRLSWEMHNGEELPADACVLHTCDNPGCVHPGHLYVGTRKDNAQDRAERKRGKEHRQQGENNDNAKLTEAQVRAIIGELQKLPRRSQTSIATEFGVNQQQVSRIMHRKNWAHLWE
jgi:predicted XRE-type DNA-binding protein